MTAEQLAREMYTAAGTPQGPPWEQLGDVTRRVWLDRAAAMLELA